MPLRWLTAALAAVVLAVPATVEASEARKITQVSKAAKPYANGYAWRTAIEAFRVDLARSVAYAVVEQESSFINQLGCDHGRSGDNPPYCRQRVTRQRVRRLLASRYSNGVGLTQLTFRPFVQEAERLGGAHIPAYQLRVGLRLIKSYVTQHGTREGLARYNGGPRPPAVSYRYAQEVINRRNKWHRRLTR